MNLFWMNFYVFAGALCLYGVWCFGVSAREVIQSATPPRMDGPVFFQEKNVSCRSRQ